MIKRLIIKELVAWKERDNRLPLILRGARQVGKTSVIEYFGQTYFENLVTVNFEIDSKAMNCFDDFDPNKIINMLSVMMAADIVPGQTLLFFDEIQECPRAIQALRYFKEKMPNLHVISAGSLLEFTLNAPKFKMPVGRVEFLYLKPLSFPEYLDAIGEERLKRSIESASMQDPLPTVLHDKANDLVRDYIIVGGMPAVVANYAINKNLRETQRLQSNLLATYRNDFGKYATKARIEILNILMDKVPSILATGLKYNKIDPDIRSAVIKDGIQLLNHAGLVYNCYATSAAGIPLNATLNYKKNKLFFVDIGLISSQSQTTQELLSSGDITLINQGALTEQFVAQELLANTEFFRQGELFHWSRDKAQSKAEVDFVTETNGRIVPIEVKSGSSKRLKSLLMLMENKKLPLGLRVSQLPLQQEGNIISIPLYMVFTLSSRLFEVFSK